MITNTSAAPGSLGCCSRPMAFLLPIPDDLNLHFQDRQDGNQSIPNFREKANKPIKYPKDPSSAAIASSKAVVQQPLRMVRHLSSWLVETRR
ncbi:uncharacterized protein H6S33_000379 [Morchella sextelata]|uniref:uncharacterized protein n=1 Tax=Morchella sextelata TaxID=1174677 RepID=UPI001D03DA92|nr:uncharacterized protein H6S33_000379 [Morchella sextelata]KAH0614743.1 hypothetical protein H6S33_000379 [Morchella sextelata]